ncbi:hypothetical protein [Nocardioides marmorisolisilvae]|nr:hypothetical protein [Nocardioides marmorisolisilvae]
MTPFRAGLDPHRAPQAQDADDDEKDSDANTNSHVLPPFGE